MLRMGEENSRACADLCTNLPAGSDMSARYCLAGPMFIHGRKSQAPIWDARSRLITDLTHMVIYLLYQRTSFLFGPLASFFSPTHISSPYRPRTMRSSFCFVASFATLAMGLRLEARAGQSSAVCTSSFAWMENSNHDSPCQVAASVDALCNNGRECQLNYTQSVA
jgi:hypothetical protein